MKKLIKLEGMSQYNASIYIPYQPSACGPTTIYVILKYWLGEKETPNINVIYKMLGTTKIGLFKWRLIKNLKRFLGHNWLIKKCTLKEALDQLDNGNPVAMKFDSYFTFQWKKVVSYKYHWVPLIGYEIINNQLYLIIHDNGGRNRESQVRKIPYELNFKVLSFVLIEPKKT